MASAYAAQLAELEAEYDRLSDQIEQRHGGVDYGGRLVALRKEMERVRGLKSKFDAMQKAVEAQTPRETGSAIVEVMLDSEPAEEIAADFIENEVGRFDWVNNWRTIREREDPVQKVRAYLLLYDIRANPEEIVNIIDRMAQGNPGRWK